MWAEFFIFGTLWFWILVSGAFITITWCIESVAYDNGNKGGGAGATFTLIAFFLIYFFLGSNEDVIAFVNWAKVNPVTIIMYLLAYYAAGVAWSIAKWYIFLKFKAHEMEEKLEKNHYSIRDNFDFDIPTAANNKARIISWMSYWPFSAIWTVLNKFLLNIWEYLYLNFEGVFNKMSKNAFAGFENKLATKRAEAAKEKENSRR